MWPEHLSKGTTGCRGAKAGGAMRTAGGPVMGKSTYDEDYHDFDTDYDEDYYWNDD